MNFLRTGIQSVLILSLAAGPVSAAPPICDGSTALTLIGMDTSTGSTLFAVPPAGDGKASWIVELDGDGEHARAWPDDPKGRFGGSVGPGPVIAAQPCGKSCLQPVRWNDGVWEPLGEPLNAPVAASATPTYDHTGAPWFLLHTADKTEGQQRAWAFRLQGGEWRNRGSMTVAAVGQPPALPAPQRKDGVLTGTGLFSASGQPEAWVAGLPGVTAARRGQLIALTGTSVAYVSGDGVVYLSDDSGKTWRRSTWTPWGGKSEAVALWRQGKDFWVDFPFGDHRGALRLVWFDHRRPSEEVVVLTRLTQSGDWVRVTEAPGQVKTKSEQLPITQILVPKGDVWLLFSGCAATANGSGLVLRAFNGTSLSPARFVPIQSK
jgi:hypothetical protein